MSQDDDNKRSRRYQLSEAARWYHANAERVVAQYESVSPQQLNAWLVPFLPAVGARILDVGAGTGRDAAWLASRGYSVFAVEPSSKLRNAAEALHPAASLHWLDDELPALQRVHRLGLSFDFILMSAVWMHIAPADRDRAFRKIITLLEPGGALALTLRQGPWETGRGMHEVTLDEIERLAIQHGAFVQKAETTQDELGRSSVSWIHVVIRLPDDGSGALPLLRHIILNDTKASTYKLALMRIFCRIADGIPGFAQETRDDHVSIPLGLVGLFWLRLFKPLLAAELPQTPRNNGLDGLGFVKNGFRALGHLAHTELRIGARFGESSLALDAAIRDACQTISAMPATFITYPGGGPVFVARPRNRSLRPTTISIDESYLSSFGEMLVPEHLWRAFRRFDVWIEPALLAEWQRLMKAYAASQGRHVNEAAMVAALEWADPERQVRVARARAISLLTDGPLHCVWTGKRLTAATLDIDHCIPWSAWPCEDLWNLMPADRRVNQHQKRERMPSPSFLRTAEERIKTWWQLGYGNPSDERLLQRFQTEARASLPVDRSRDPNLDEIFDALTLLQLRLTHDQQVPLWIPNIGNP